MDETATEHDPVFLTRRPRAPLGGYIDVIWLWRGSVERRGKDRRSAVHRRHTCDWADVALACGYYDQAHLIRDSRTFSGFSPAQDRASVGEFSNHVAIE